MNLAYIFREGFRGLRRNLTMTIALIITTAITLALLGTAVLIGQMTEDTKQIYLDRVEVMVQFDEAISAGDTDCSSPECSSVRSQLESSDDVESVRFRSRQESYERFVEIFRESDPTLVQETTPDALPAALHVRLADPTDISPLDAVAHMPGVVRVVDQTDDVSAATDNLDSIRNAATILAVVQLIATIFLVANMVILSAHSRRDETSIMRIVGAHRRMTQGPFAVEAMLAALIGAVLGTVGMVLGNRFVVAPALSGVYDSGLLARVSDADVWRVMPLLGLGGVVLAGAVAWITLRVYVRK